MLSSAFPVGVSVIGHLAGAKIDVAATDMAKYLSTTTAATSLAYVKCPRQAAYERHVSAAMMSFNNTLASRTLSPIASTHQFEQSSVLLWRALPIVPGIPTREAGH